MAFAAKTMKRKNVKGLALNAPQPVVPAPSLSEPLLPDSRGRIGGREGDLEIGVEFRLSLREQDIVVLKELGAGNGGTVSKVRHAVTNSTMARKIIHVEAKEEIRKRIIRELDIMHECNSPYIISFYGAFTNDVGDVVMCMEYMDCGSLDAISRNFGPVRVDRLGKIAEAVLGGLTYLYRYHRIMHRDIKPSNILMNSKGQIKLCDFGVSSELENSIADTFVGTGTYMSPERIQGSPYTVKSDVWSVGLTLLELAVGKPPYAFNFDENGEERGEPAGPLGILDLLQAIVMEPSPKLPKNDAFPLSLEQLIEKCLKKNPEERPTPRELYETDNFLFAAKATPVDLREWAVSMMEKHHRHSHLTPHSAVDTKAALRGVTPQAQSSARYTSTGDIPFGSLSLSSDHPYPRGLELATPSTSSSVPPPESSGRPWPTRTSSAIRSFMSPPLSADRNTRPPTTSGPLPPLPPLPRKPVPTNPSVRSGDYQRNGVGGFFPQSPEERRYY